MANRFKKKVAVITGAAQGIGKRVAEKMAKEKGTLVLVDRSELVHEVAKELSGKVEVLSLTADLEKFADCKRVMEAAVEKFGRIDILINNVGGTIWTKPFEHYDEDEIESEVRRSLFPTLWCCRAALPYMQEQGKGAIVNVSSIATRGVNRVPYGAAKGGVVNLTRCSAMDCAPESIRVNAICPGYLEDAVSLGDTTARTRNMAELIAKHPLGRLARTSEVAAAIAVLASDDASFVTGACLMVDGGYTAQ